MSKNTIHMNCGGVGRYVQPHEVDHWKGKGYVVTEEPAAQPKEAAKTSKTAKTPKQPKEAAKAKGQEQAPANPAKDEGKDSGDDAGEGSPQ